MAEAMTIQNLFKELHEIKQMMVSKEELFSYFETLDILHHPETMWQIRASEEDICAGRTKKVKSVKDLLEEIE